MQRVVTGIRPTGDLTVGNYAGGMRPLAELQDTYNGRVNAFVADLHGLTDQPPHVINAARLDTVRSFMAAGVDPAKTNLYMQSHIGGQTFTVEWWLSRGISLARATRVPTLKEKLSKEDPDHAVDISAASMALGRYPLLMAADIAVQDAHHVPVGKDQYPHLDITREAIRHFNRTFGAGEDVLVVPEAYEDKGVNILSLTGNGKMSKSDPKGALLLKDSPDAITAKIRSAKTAAAGIESPEIENYILLCERLGAAPEEVGELRRLYTAHLAGSAVMKQFKTAMTDIVVDFTQGFQERFNNLSDAEVKAALKRGNAAATRRANQVVKRMEEAAGFVTAG